MNTQLLCLFTTKQELDKSVDFILKNYILTNPNVFILENKSKPEEAFITFKVWANQDFFPGAIEINCASTFSLGKAWRTNITTPSCLATQNPP